MILTVGAHTHRMDSMRDTCDPVWSKDNVFDFPIEVVHGQELLMEFYDDDSRKDDEFMGRAKIQTNLVAERGHIEVSVSLMTATLCTVCFSPGGLTWWTERRGRARSRSASAG